MVLAIIAVWTAEALNTAFEALCNVASPEFHPLVERAKDVAAGAVLISAIGAVVVGLLVFGPRLLGCIRLTAPEPSGFARLPMRPQGALGRIFGS